MVDIADPSSAFPGQGTSGIDTHDESYAAARPDGVGRSQIGGNGEGEYIKVDNDDHQHFCNMMDSTVAPLVARLRREIDAIPDVECGTFPHGADLQKKVAKFRADYRGKCDEIDTGITSLRKANQIVGQKYGVTDDENADTAGSVGAQIGAAEAAVASLGRPGSPGEPGRPDAAPAGVPAAAAGSSVG
jgi:hypothetical protein